MRTSFQPSLASFAASIFVFGSASLASSRTTSSPAACFAESADFRPSLRTFFGSLMAWLRGCGPKATPPPRKIGALRLPCRARPVPF